MVEISIPQDTSTTTAIKLGGEVAVTSPPEEPASVDPLDPAPATSLPDDDGGTLCAAAEALEDPTADLQPFGLIDELIQRADDFRRQGELLGTLVEVAPPSLKGDAREFAAQFGKLADLLEELDTQNKAQSSGAGRTRDEANLTMSRILIDAAGVPVDDSADQVRYDSYFLSWIAPPCGPKELVIEVAR